MSNSCEVFRQNKELLQEVFENASLAQDSVGKLIKSCTGEENGEFRCKLAQQFADYHTIMDEAMRAALERNLIVKDRPGMKRMVFGGISANLIIDKTPSHMAEMLVQGSIMGVIDMTRALKEHSDAAQDIRALAQRLLEAENKNICEMLLCV